MRNISAGGKIFQLVVEWRPDVADVAFGRANVSDRKAQSKLVVQLGVRQKSFAVRINATQNRFVESVKLFRFNFLSFAFNRRTRAKTNQRKRQWRHHLPVRRFFDPRREQFCQTAMFADALGESFTAEVANDHPQFQGAKAAAKLDAVI